ncbi:MAG: GH3 auxin-responsive promoter family protein [Bacteroidia bacterium]|nr:GH3 auxin-responsive promoter family protein [Bacteroidia bacterium]MDW8089691.1 GH3 auxin-responsive promoter family protein [Bacteroidia bacterium]
MFPHPPKTPFYLEPLYGLLRLPYRRLAYSRADPLSAQHRWFRRLLKAGSKTRYGQVVGITSDLSYEAFSARVPIHTYEELYPWIERALRGEADVLWPGQVRWFARSSGTTNDRSKFIPIPPMSLHENHFRAARQLFATYLTLYQGRTQLLQGKVISIGGSHTVSHLGPHARYGDLSAVLLANMPAFYRYFRAPSLEIALLPSWEEKVHRMAEALLQIPQSIVGVAGVPTWTVVLFDEILRRTRAAHILEVFPRFEVFFHGAVSFTPYEKLFAQYLPASYVRYIEIYNASEGFFAFQDTVESKAMLLMTDHAVFYEFIPYKDWEAGVRRAIPLWAVQPGETYALVITTAGGLWRYLIGDTVRFVSTNPYRLYIVGRTRHYINAFGEEVMVEQAEKAVEAACAATQATVRDFTVAPIYLEAGQRGAHQWLIEFIQPPSSLEQFTEVLDQTLRQLNSDYDAKREKDLALGPPQLVVLPPDTFHRWLKQKGRLGGQNKVPRLSNDRGYVEEILAVAALSDQLSAPQ